MERVTKSGSHIAAAAVLPNAALALVYAAPALAQQETGPWRMHDWGWGWGGMWLGPLFMLVLLGLVVALFVWLVQWVSGGRGSAQSDTTTAREVLDARYARGEIDREEYLKRRHDISGA